MESQNHWFQKITAYHLLIDRFAGISDKNSHLGGHPVFCGGNLADLTRRLDYLQDLGINTLWLSPFMQSTPNEAAYHGYHVVDYQVVDSRFGNLSDLDHLIQEVHGRSMHIIADFVPNHIHHHSNLLFEWENNQPKVKTGYEDWFKYKENGELSAYFGYTEIPQLNLDHPPAREYMINSALYWLERGIDGLRLDYAAGPSHDFWKAFRSTIKNRFPQSVLIGEVWHEWLKYEHIDQVGLRNKASKAFRERIDRDELQAEYIGSLDGVLDFSFQSMLIHYFKARKKYGNDKKLRYTLDKALEEHYARYPKDFFLVSFLDNHDIDRFLFSIGGNSDYLREAVEIQMAQNHPALLYYGTELGLMNRAAIDRDFPYSDVMVRPIMPWNLLEQESNGQFGKAAKAMRAHFRKVIHNRYRN